MASSRTRKDKPAQPDAEAFLAVPVDPGETAAIVAAGPSPALLASVRRADEYRLHAKAKSTRRAYKDAWDRFLAWAAAASTPPLPASPAAVCAHLGWLADQGYGISIVQKFLSAGSHYHRAAGFDFPRSAPVVAEMLGGIRREIGAHHKQKAPLEVRELSVICERLRGSADVDSVRNRAMLTVGWFCMLRSANLVAIQREHVRLVRYEGGGPIDDDEEPNGLMLFLPGSKTDRRKEGRTVATHAQPDEDACPVRAVRAYFQATRFAPGDRIFPISERTLSRLIKRLVANPTHGHKTFREIERCASCVVAISRFASHSLRRGAATTQARMGVPEREIMRQGGWKNERVMRGYIEYATLFENNPTKNLTSKKEPK